MPRRPPSNTEIISMVVLTVVAVTFIGIGAVASILWLVK